MPPPVGADAGPAPDGGGAADVLVLPDTPLPPGDGGELADGGLPTVDAPLPGDACASVFFADDDMDGFGDAADSIVACAAPAGFVAVSGDCDDADLDVSPDATERCEAARVDDDCDGMPNDGCECDESTVRPCPGDSDVGECVPGTQTCDAEGRWGACMGTVGPMPEACDGRDTDCDGDLDGPAALASCGTPAFVAVPSCGGAAGCGIAACTSGHGDCNTTFGDGCETPFGTTSNCTACGESCGWACSSTGCNDVTAIAAGTMFSCALRDDGSVVCWGGRDEGRLGDGSTSGTPVITPVRVMGLPGRAVAIAAGTSHACAIVESGTERHVYCWGDNDHGQLGMGSIGGVRATAVRAGSIIDAASIDLGTDFSCALRTGGRIWCWGIDTLGQLGDGSGSSIDRHTPTLVDAIGSTLPNASQIAVGDTHACAIVGTVGARLYCWGGNSQSQLGSVGGMSAVPVEVGGGLTGYALVAAGVNHTCAMTAEVRIGMPTVYTTRCWGDNAMGQLGDGTTTDRPTPATVVGLSRVTHLAAGSMHTCARQLDGSLYCWGENGFSQLGDGSTTRRLTPVRVSIPFPATSYFGVTIAAGPTHNCTIEPDGTPLCWGRNTSAECGRAVAPMVTAPLPVTAP